MFGKCLAVVVVLLVTVSPAIAAERAELAGVWILDPALSDDAVTVIRNGGRRGDGFGRDVARGGVGVFGIPPSSLPPRASGAPAERYPGAGAVIEHVKRLVVEISDEAVVLEYGNAVRRAYRPGALEREGGATRLARWSEGAFEIEHELANGASITERYEYEARAAELHWTARFKPPKGSGFDIERVFYRSRVR